MDTAPVSTCTPVDVLTFPVRAAWWGVEWLAQKVAAVFTRFIGFFVRTGVFMLGVYNEDWLKREIMELIKSSPCDPASRSRLDPSRMEASIKILEELGGIRSNVWTKDGQKINYMLLRSQDVQAKIESLGGKLIEVTESDTTYSVITHDQPTPEWKEFANSVLGRMGWENGTFAGVKGYCTATWENEARPKKGSVIIYAPSANQSYAMMRTTLGQHLGLGLDICTFNFRGFDSGEASEGGYYLDASAIYDEMENFGYRKIALASSCLGASALAHTKSKHPDSPFVVIKTFDTAERLLGNQPLFAGWLAPLGIPSLQSDDPQITRRVKQDGFDFPSKFEAPAHRGAPFMIISVHTDKTVAPGTHKNLCEAAQKAGDVYEMSYLPKDTTGNGHVLHPLDDPAVWRWHQMHLLLAINQ